MDTAVELAAVRTELARADTKAATLLGLAGTAVSVAAGLAALGTRAALPVPTLIGAWTAVAHLAVSVVVLLLAVRPQLPRPGAGHGWPAYAYATVASLAATVPADAERARHAELIRLSRLVGAKYRRIRIAVDLLLLALAAAAGVAIALIAGGAA